MGIGVIGATEPLQHLDFLLEVPGVWRVEGLQCEEGIVALGVLERIVSFGLGHITSRC